MLEAGDNYFQSYEDLEIHKLMLNDTVRNQCYKKAIFENKEDFKDAVVLDLGAGTGILSIFCAQAGAAKVYAVEASETYKIALELIKENNFENVIEVIHKPIESIQSLPGNVKVDIIVSEWMGFYLLHEGMLDSVIYARNKFLKSNGLMFPESAAIYTAPCSLPDYYEKWSDVEGVSMNCFAAKLREKAAQKPETTIIPEDHLLTQPETITWLDLNEIELEDLSCVKNIQQTVVVKSGKFQGLCIWFECTFPGRKFEPVVLSTAPGNEDTHWKQTVIVLPNEGDVDEGEPIFYNVVINRNQSDVRRYNLELELLDPEKVAHPEYCTCHMTKCILTRAMYDKYSQDDEKMQTNSE